MKRILIALAISLLFSGAVYAEPADVLMVDQAIVICFDASGAPDFAEVRYTKVTTNSDTGEIVYSVHGECLGTAPEQAMHWNNANTGFICAGDAPYFQMTVTPSGRMGLKCQNWPFDD